MTTDLKIEKKLKMMALESSSSLLPRIARKLNRQTASSQKGQKRE